MKKTLTALTLAICAVGTSQAAPIQWTVASGGNDHFYEYVGDGLTAPEAALAALAMGGYLATVTSAAENAFVSDTVAGGALSWLGGSDDGAAVNDWTWRFGPEAGDTFTYSNWWAGEPNNCCGGENYLHTNWGATGYWNDHGGPGNPGQRNGYIVEYYVPEPMTLALVMSALLAGAVTRRRRA